MRKKVGGRGSSNENGRREGERPPIHIYWGTTNPTRYPLVSTDAMFKLIVRSSNFQIQLPLVCPSIEPGYLYENLFRTQAEKEMCDYCPVGSFCWPLSNFKREEGGALLGMCVRARY